MAGTTNMVIAELTRYASLIAGIVRDSRKPGAGVRRNVFVATMQQLESDLDDLRRTADLGDAGHAIMETASALNHAQAKPESMATFLRYAQVSIATAIKQYRRQHPAGQSLKSTAIKTSQRVVLPDGTQGVVTGVALGDNGEPLVRVRAVKADGALLNWFREVSVNGRARGLQFSASEPDSMIRAAERAGWIERRPNYPSGVTNPQYDITPKGRNALKQQPARSVTKSADVIVLAASEVRAVKATPEQQAINEKYDRARNTLMNVYKKAYTQVLGMIRAQGNVKRAVYEQLESTLSTVSDEHRLVGDRSNNWRSTDPAGYAQVALFNYKKPDVRLAALNNCLGDLKINIVKLASFDKILPGVERRQRPFGASSVSAKAANLRSAEFDTANALAALHSARGAALDRDLQGTMSTLSVAKGYLQSLLANLQGVPDASVSRLVRNHINTVSGLLTLRRGDYSPERDILNVIKPMSDELARVMQYIKQQRKAEGKSVKADDFVALRPDMDFHEYGRTVYQYAKLIESDPNPTSRLNKLNRLRAKLKKLNIGILGGDLPYLAKIAANAKRELRGAPPAPRVTKAADYEDTATLQSYVAQTITAIQRAYSAFNQSGQASIVGLRAPMLWIKLIAKELKDVDYGAPRYALERWHSVMKWGEMKITSKDPEWQRMLRVMQLCVDDMKFIQVKLGR